MADNGKAASAIEGVFLVFWNKYFAIFNQFVSTCVEHLSLSPDVVRKGVVETE